MHHRRFRPLHDLLSLIYPEVCIHCGELLVGDERNLCTYCLSQIEWSDNATVPFNEVEQRLIGHIPVQAAATLMHFKKQSVVQDIIHQIKYHGNTSMAHNYGILLGEALLNSGRFQDIDYIVPVPLHRSRKRRRGYNQSQLISEGISQVLGIPISANNLYRKRRTKTQTHKSREERQTNVNGAFAVRHPKIFQNKHILLVDDVITTGATTESCYKSLAEIEGLGISIAALALAT